MDEEKFNAKILFYFGFIYYKKEDFPKSEQFLFQALKSGQKYKKYHKWTFRWYIYGDYNSVQKSWNNYNSAQSVSINNSKR